MRAWVLQIASLSVMGILSVSAWGQSNLAVKAATNKRVDLSWSGTASSYTIQRAPLGGAFASIGTAASPTYSDTTVDAYTTYQYQIVAGATSNSVTVGPPPSGLTAPAPAPLVGSTPSNTYGNDLTLALDGNGDPAFAFVWEDPNGDGDLTDTALMFRSWNRAQYAWNPVVKVGVVTDSVSSSYLTDSLAFDSSTGMFAIACEHNSDQSLDLFVSSDGVTWTKKTNFSYSDPVAAPSLALSAGNIFLSFGRAYEGIVYVTGSLASDPSTWTTTLAPIPTGTLMAQQATSISLALDSAGNPGIAYFAGDPKNDPNQILMFWKPASGNPPVKVTDSENQQSGTAAKLVYYGTNPRILFYLSRLDTADPNDGNHYVQSNDGGGHLATPAPIPPDGTSTTDYPFDMTVGSQGQVAVAFGQNGGSGDSVCPNPKLSLSSDGVHFTTCAIASEDVLSDYGPYPSAIQIAYGGNDKLYYLWWADEGNSADDSGIVMYREPPPGAITGPVIDSVADGASFRPNIVAGSWVTVKGGNLSTQTRIWAGSDFPGGGDNSLPTDLSGVEVKVNGVLCAVYYISPSQINFQAPSNVSGSVTVQVFVNNIASNTLTANAVAIAPALFTYAAGGTTFPAAVFPANGLIVGDPAVSGTVVSKAQPADVISLYATGMMATPAGVIPGGVISVSTPVTVTFTSTADSSVTANAVESFAGLTAVGEFQVNIVVPNLPSGSYYVVVGTGGQSTQSGVVIPIA